MFPIKNCLKHGDNLSLLLFSFALDYAIRKVQVNQDGVKGSLLCCWCSYIGWKRTSYRVKHRTYCSW